MKHKIVTSVTIYPFGRNATGKGSSELDVPSSRIMVKFGTISLGRTISSGNGMFYHLDGSSTVLLTIAGEDGFVFRDGYLILAGNIKDGTYLSIKGVDYQFDSREPNFLEKRGLEADELI